MHMENREEVMGHVQDFAVIIRGGHFYKVAFLYCCRFCYLKPCFVDSVVYSVLENSGLNVLTMPI